MFVVLYRWRIVSGMEDQFVESWSEVTKFYLDNFDSLGSRLHKEKAGIWYGYAQWQSAEQRDIAFEDREKLLSADVLIDARNRMSESIEETLPEIHLQIAADFLKTE